ncbi:MAG TPA: hypothetical protein PJ997_00605 [Candidatus Paceibacterota bacterium]|nr:hypothetical protein [Candidatus Paceibacterota bacterium]HMP18826.1 hypothetical protein [Candidatus Paceibacterota bacterium]
MTIEIFIQRLSNVIINPLIFVVFAVAFVIFLWGVFEFIRDAESADGRETGKRHILWGIVGMVIMMGVFSIIRIALRTVYG